jgi:PKD domain
MTRLAACALSCAALLAAAPAASAQFQFPVPPVPLVGQPTGSVNDPVVDIDPTGRVVMAWGTNAGVHVAERLPGSGSVTLLGTFTPAGAPHVGVDDAGNATVAWGGITTGFHVVRIPRQGAPGAVQTYEPTYGSDAALAVAPDGAAVMSWTDSTDHPHAAYRAAGATTFGTDIELDSANEARNSTDAVITSAGRAIVVWQNVTNDSIEFALRTPSSGFGNAAPVFDTTTGVFQPRLAADGAGNAYVIWLNAIVDTTNERIQYSQLPGNVVGWTPMANVSAGNENVSVSTLELASDPAGNLAAVWTRDTDDVIFSKLKAPGQGWPVGAGQRVTPLGVAGFQGGLAASPGNGFLAVWNQGNGTADDTADAAFRGVGSGAWTALPRLGFWETGASDPVSLAIDPAGNAAVAFATLLDTMPPAEGAQIAIGDGGAPPDLTLSVPASAEAGEPVATAMTASDFSGVASQTIAFGDGSSEPGPAASHTYAQAGTFTVTATATDARGNTATTDATIVVRDTGAPAVSGLALSNKVFAVARRATPISAGRKPRRGTKVSYRSSEAGGARLRIERRRLGFRRGRRCLAKRPREVRRPRRCTRFVRAGTLTRDAKPGGNSVRFSGRIGRRALRRGRYRLTLVVTDAAGNASKPSRVGFRIVRAR